MAANAPHHPDAVLWQAAAAADWSAAEDLTAAVFLQAWRRRSEVALDRDSALPWLLGVARLTRQQRDVIELCVYAGLDQQAAALSLGVSVGTVKARLHRARRRLAAELGVSQPARAPGGPPATTGSEEL